MRKGIKEKDIKNFEKHCGKLNELMLKIREYAPEVILYAADGSLYLLSDSESGSSGSGYCQEKIVADVYISFLDSGAW